MQITREQLKKLIMEVIKVKTKKTSTDDFVYVVVDYSAIGINYIKPKIYKVGQEEEIKEYIKGIQSRSKEPTMRVIKCKELEIKGMDKHALQEYAVELVEDEPHRIVFFNK